MTLQSVKSKTLVTLSYLAQKTPVCGIILHSSQQTARLSVMKAKISRTYTAASLHVPNQQCSIMENHEYGVSSADAASKRKRKVSGA